MGADPSLNNRHTGKVDHWWCRCVLKMHGQNNALMLIYILTSVLPSTETSWMLFPGSSAILPPRRNSRAQTSSRGGEEKRGDDDGSSDICISRGVCLLSRSNCPGKLVLCRRSDDREVLLMPRLLRSLWTEIVLKEMFALVLSS